MTPGEAGNVWTLATRDGALFLERGDALHMLGSLTDDGLLLVEALMPILNAQAERIRELTLAVEEAKQQAELNFTVAGEWMGDSFGHEKAAAALRDGVRAEVVLLERPKGLHRYHGGFHESHLRCDACLLLERLRTLLGLRSDDGNPNTLTDATDDPAIIPPKGVEDS